MIIAIIDYKLGNLFSISHALNHLNVETIITNNHDEILKADGVILPGVGSFNNAMQNIVKLGLDETLDYIYNSNIPLLGICLGFQLLFTSSTEVKLTKGLNFINGDVISFNEVIPKSKIPNIGWIRLGKIVRNSILLDGISADNYMFFVHSFFVKDSIEFCVCNSDYQNVSFTSVIEKGNVFGTQFHPEKSGTTGLLIYKNFVDYISKRKG